MIKFIKKKLTDKKESKNIENMMNNRHNIFKLAEKFDKWGSIFFLIQIQANYLTQEDKEAIRALGYDFKVIELAVGMVNGLEEDLKKISDFHKSQITDE